MELSMKGRNALITGGSLGIGRAIAKAFVEAGANVAIVARRQDVLDDAKVTSGLLARERVVTISVDIATAKAVRMRLLKRNKRLEVLMCW